MAKNKHQAQAPAQPSSSPKQTTIHSYRVEKLGQFEYQGFKLTRSPDGTYQEERFGKADLLELVARKIFEALKREAAEVFQANKKAV